MNTKKIEVIGQTQAQQKLDKLEKNHFPQTLICLGPSGVGKKKSIHAHFQKMVCTSSPKGEACGQCPACQKVFENQHLDYIEIKATNSQIISVEDLREMKKVLYFSPVEAPIRFIVIDEAHKLNTQSANYLLKTLEEPPAHTRFFLITHERSLLLPTLLSRCHYLSFSPLSKPSLQKILSHLDYEIPNEIEDFLFDNLNGGLSKIDDYLNEENKNFLHSLHQLFKKDTALIRKTLLDELQSSSQKTDLFLDYMIWSEYKKNLTQAQDPMLDLHVLYRATERTQEFSTLKRRLEMHANKKLIALAALCLGTDMGAV